MSGTDLGVFLALSTAFSWAFAGIIHTSISRIIGIEALMLVRQPLATLVLGICCLFAGGLFVPSAHLLWLSGASGMLGIVLGDACFYAAALSIGLRATQVCMSLSATCTALLGACFLGERIGLQGWFGIAVATCGVALVIMSERGEGDRLPGSHTKRKGVILALMAALFLAIGMIFSKQAMEEGLSALQLSFYRNLIATLGVWVLASARGHVRTLLKRTREHPETLRLFLSGCLFGPAGGIWLSCMAILLLPTGVASMLISLEPVALLLILGIMERRMPSFTSVSGAVLACTGAAILLLRHTS